MKKIYLTLICLIAIITPSFASELYLFEADVYNDEYIANTILFDIPENIDKNWYPLRAISQWIPITVDWDNEYKAVIIDNGRIVRRYGARELTAYKDNIVILDGVTYCSPKFINQQLYGIGFIYNDAVYCFNGELMDKFIYGGDSLKFVKYTKTAFFELYLKSPDDYKFIKENLSGGVSYVPSDKSPYKGALGYVYAQRQNPICYIIGDYKIGANLISLIAHEAKHVYQHRINGENTEQIATDYELYILNKILGGDFYG